MSLYSSIRVELTTFFTTTFNVVKTVRYSAVVSKLSDYWDYSNVKYFSKACLIDNVFDRNPSVVNPYFNEPFHPAWLDE